MKIVKKIISLLILIPTFNILSNAAGVLPFTYDTKFNIYFYLSREVYGKDRGTFSDFGGSFEEISDSYEKVAAREFAEESMEIFKSDNNETLNIQNTFNLIKKEKPPKSLIKFGNWGYTTFFIKVKNLKNYFEKFNKKRKKLLDKFKKNPTKKLAASIEKDVLISVSKDDLIMAIKSNQPTIRVRYTSNHLQVPSGSIVNIRRSTFESLKLAYNNGTLDKLDKKKIFKKIKKEFSLFSNKITSLYNRYLY